MSECYFAIFNNFSVIFVLEIDGCSIGMQFGINLAVFAVKLNGLSILGVCFFHIVGTIGSLQ